MEKGDFLKIFADTADLDELKELNLWGVIDGCTTNPKIIAVQKVDFESRMKEILKLVSGPVSIEVTSNNLDEMIQEGKKFSAWGKNAVIKLPMTVNGLKALQVLKQEKIKTNVTACMSVNQAVLAAKAGATYVSLFYSRIGDLGYDARIVIQDTVKVFDRWNYSSEIIVGSIRHLMQVQDAMLAGVDIVTIPFNYIKQMTQNPQTDATLDEFLRFWNEYKGNKK